MKRPIFAICLLYIFLIIILRPIIDRPPVYIADQQINISGIIASEPVQKEERLAFELLADKGIKGKIRVYAPVFDARYGDRISAAGNVSYIQGLKNPGLDQSDYISFAAIDRPKVLSRGHGNALINAAICAKKKLSSVINQILPAPYSSLLSGLILGISDGSLPQDITENFKKAGTIHMLVVSGTQISLLIGVCLAICGALRLSPLSGFIVSSLFNLFFVVMAGAGTSVVRAAIMAEMAMLAKILNREQDFLTTLSASAMIILILNPFDLFNIGFQLSYAATVALFFVAPKISERFNYLPGFFAQLLGITIAPIIITAPIIYYNFSQVSLISFFSNAIIICWINFVVIIGFAAIMIGLVYLPAAKLLGGGLFVMLWTIDYLIGLFAGLPFACYYLAAPSILAIIFYYVFTAWILNKPNFNRFSFSVIALSAALILIWNAALAPAEEIKGKILTAVFFDVGQGDSIFIQAPSGKNMLIDGGPFSKSSDAGKKAVLPYLHKKGINKLDVVVLTHPHDDHVGGLVSVLKDLKVDTVIDSGQAHTSLRYLKFLELIDKKKIKYVEARAGQNLDLGSGVKGQVLHPSEPLIEESALNNNSVVIRLSYGKVSFLFTGDAEKEAEKGLLGRATVLKVGHHGSRTASSQEFLDAVKPRIAIISCGRKNKFKHPHKTTLKKLEETGIKVYRTDLFGAVVVKTDGEKMVIENQ